MQEAFGSSARPENRAPEGARLLSAGSETGCILLAGTALISKQVG